jgi:photosystem II stability/assembly factor-like uncharacterized protein
MRSSLVFKVTMLLALTTAISMPALSQQLIEQGHQTAQLARLVAQAPIMALSSEGTNTIAVGARGHILTQVKDQWLQTPAPIDVLLTDVAWADQENAWAVGHDATIIHTNDSGNSWQIQQYIPSLDRPLLDVYFANASEGFAVGAYGLYFNTVDGGKQWQRQFLISILPQDDIDYLQEIKLESEQEYQYEIESILPHFNQIIGLNDQKLLLVGELGLVAISEDLGKSWRRLSDIYAGSFFSALMTKQQNILIGGLRGNVYRSSDLGNSWHKVVLGNNYSVNKFYQLANGDIYAAQNNGVLLKSIDDGLTFQQAALYKGQDIVGIAQVGEQLWLGTSKGLVKHQLKQ